jgi:hypothetical protein
MKLALIGAAAVAAAAFATPTLAQAVSKDAGDCAQFDPNANCQALGGGNLYTEGGSWRTENAMVLGYATQSTESEAHRYHGGPKVNN